MSRTILVVEDSALIAMAVATELERAGHRVLGPAVANAPALELARQRRPDLALVDIDLQGGDSGSELVRALHAELGVPSVFVTGQGDEASGDIAGALGVLSKPFKLAALRETVVQALAYVDGGETPVSDGGRVRWF